MASRKTGRIDFCAAFRSFLLWICLVFDGFSWAWWVTKIWLSSRLSWETEFLLQTHTRMGIHFYPTIDGGQHALEWIYEFLMLWKYFLTAHQSATFWELLDVFLLPSLLSQRCQTFLIFADKKTPEAEASSKKGMSLFPFLRFTPRWFFLLQNLQVRPLLKLWSPCHEGQYIHVWPSDSLYVQEWHHWARIGPKCFAFSKTTIAIQ